jgi:peptidoglycan/LPS O-acetylase OafA/YrhL
MLNGVITFASVSAFPSGIVGDLLSKWEAMGFFSYLLPFLLLFALVFGILTKTHPLGDNKMINGIIALAVGLMALQFDFVPTFFSQIFPRLGVGLAIILGILIVVGLFMPKESKMMNWILLAIGALVIGVVLVQATGAAGWQSGEWWGDNWQMVVGAIFLFVLIAVIIGSSNPDKPRTISKEEWMGPWAK